MSVDALRIHLHRDADRTVVQNLLLGLRELHRIAMRLVEVAADGHFGSQVFQTVHLQHETDAVRVNHNIAHDQLQEFVPRSGKHELPQPGRVAECGDDLVFADGPAEKIALALRLGEQIGGLFDFEYVPLR